MTTPDAHVLQALHPRVALAFDFDETLAPGTTDVLLSHLGVDPDEFSRQHVDPREDDGWEHVLAEAHALRELSLARDGGPITDETFAEVGEVIELYPGVPEMFGRVREAVAEVDADVEVEFHLITAGFVNVPSHTPIAHEFDSIIGGHWAYDDDGGVLTPKSTVGHYDKVRYLLAIAKGLDAVAADDDRDPDVPLPDEEWHVPIPQIVFVGDGDSDLPAFDFLQSNGGAAIAVRQSADAASWESRSDMRDGREVVALAESDFSEGSPLLAVLLDAARRAALRVRMLRTGHDIV